MQVIKTPISNNGKQQIQDYVNKIQKILTSKELLYYIADKAQQTVDKITIENLNTDDEQQYIHTYRNNNQVKIDGDTIIVFNQTLISATELSDKIRENYPNGFDLAKAVEYGTGQIGAGSEASNYAGDDDWSYMQNPERDYSKAWSYEANGKVQWTRGMEGKLIYVKLKNEVEKNLGKWINDYIIKEMGG